MKISFTNEAGVEETVETRIVDLQTKDKVEYGIFENGMTLRLDQIRGVEPVAVIQYTSAKTAGDIQQIFDLQKINLPTAISEEESKEQGFVTINHELELLQFMNQPYPHAIAKVDHELAGYALVMLRELENRIPLLVPMFAKINAINHKGQLLKESRYFIMGQVCVAKAYRRKGVFAGLYHQLKETDVVSL